MKLAIQTSLLLPALTTSSGCCLPLPRGDARVVDCVALIGRCGDHNVELTLPTFPIDKAGTTWARVRNLRPYSWQLWTMEVEGADKTGDVATWPLRDVVVTLTLRTSNGETLSSESNRLGDLFPGSGPPDRNLNDWKKYLDGRRDFDIGVTVLQPVPVKHARISISAGTTYNTSDR